MQKRNQRNAIADAVLIALIALVSTVITVVFEKETNNSLSKIIYDENKTASAAYPKIILTDEFQR